MDTTSDGGGTAPPDVSRDVWPWVPSNGGLPPAAATAQQPAVPSWDAAAEGAQDAAAAPATRRSERNRDKISFNEDLVYAIHNEMMGLGKKAKGGKGRKVKLEDSQQPSSRHTKGGGEGAGEDDADSHRAPKKPRSGLGPQKGMVVEPRGGGSEDVSDAEASGAEELTVLDPNAETAWAVGLNATGLADEEEGLLPEGADEAVYAKIRNQILARWRSNVSRFLPEKEAIASLPKKDKAYGLAAWRFLHTLGFINFGIAPDIADQMASCPDDKGTVVVVGAGCAGLAAARQLRMLGYRVVVVEGRGRPGGRVYSMRMEGQGVAAVADLGGSIITGIDGNPLATVVKQMGVNMLDIRTDTPLFMSNGVEADKKLDQLIEDHHNYLLDECSNMRDRLPESAKDMSLGETLESLWEQHLETLPLNGKGGEAAVQARKLFDWHLANLEFANASLVPTLSLKFWDQDDPNELLGAHTFVPGGNSRWVSRLCEGLPIFYNSPVSKVSYDTEGVAVHAGGRIFEADSVVVTVPLGVLKRDRITFNPPLTERKKATIARLGFGVLNKVIMLFPYVFWSDKIDMFGRVSDSAEDRGEAFLFYSYANISGGALLIGLVAGKAALKYEQLSPGEATRRVMGVLRSIYEPRGVRVPAPVEVVCTQWGSDPMCHGAYSSMAVGTVGGDDYDILAESLGGRVFFAGEATSNKYPATMHGAFYTGLQVAANVDATLQKAQRRASSAVAKAATAKGAIAKAAAAKAAGAAAATAAATARAAPTVRNPGTKEEAGPAEEPSPASSSSEESEDEELGLALADLAATQESAAQLRHVFQEPDLEFGCFAAVHGPQGGELAGQSLLRVDLGVVKGGPRRPIPMYLCVDRQLALLLADTPGDESRVALMSALPDVKLLGRHGLSSNALALLSALMSSRNGAGAGQQPQSQLNGHAQQSAAAPLRTAETAARGGAATAAAPPALAQSASPAGALQNREGARAEGFVIPRLSSGPASRPPQATSMPRGKQQQQQPRQQQSPHPHQWQQPRQQPQQQHSHVAHHHHHHQTHRQQPQQQQPMHPPHHHQQQQVQPQQIVYPHRQQQPQLQPQQVIYPNRQQQQQQVHQQQPMHSPHHHQQQQQQSQQMPQQIPPQPGQQRFFWD